MVKRGGVWVPRLILDWSVGVVVIGCLTRGCACVGVLRLFVSMQTVVVRLSVQTVRAEEMSRCLRASAAMVKGGL